MLKKLGIVAVIVVAGFLVLRMTKVGSYAGTAWSKIRASANNQVPVEFEIDRIRHEIAQLAPDMKKHLSAIAEEMVAVDNLREEIKTAEAKLEQQKRDVLALKDTLNVNRNAVRVSYRGRDFNRVRLEEKLDRDWTAYRSCEAEVKSRKQLLDAKERSLEIARDQLAAMRDQKRELEVQVAQLEADVKAVRLAQTQSQFQFDDSRLTEIKQTLANIRNRLKLEQTELRLRGEFATDGDSVVTQKKTRSPSEVSQEIDNHFKDDGDTKVVERK